MSNSGVSIGVSPLASLDRLDEALRHADEAMYAAKCAGRDRVVTSPPNSGPFVGEIGSSGRSVLRVDRSFA